MPRGKFNTLEDYVVEDHGYDTPCWIWQGTINPDGYGKLAGKSVHRVAYEKKHGPIPNGFQLDHLCRTRACANPDHLEVVTLLENVYRGRSHARMCLLYCDKCGQQRKQSGRGCTYCTWAKQAAKRKRLGLKRGQSIRPLCKQFDAMKEPKKEREAYPGDKASVPEIKQ